MNKHVVNLELAKRLKEAGYPQESEFWWHPRKLAPGVLDDEHPERHGEDYHVSKHKHGRYNGELFSYAAPLATELLERLPNKVTNETQVQHQLVIFKEKNWKVHYSSPTSKLYETSYKSLPDALAEIYLWLKENGYLPPKD